MKITYFFKGTWLGGALWPPFLASESRHATILYSGNNSLFKMTLCKLINVSSSTKKKYDIKKE